MQSLRIALALFGFVLVWFLVLPAEPTLFSSRYAPTAADATGMGDVPATDSSPEPVAQEPEQQGTTIRSIVPSPLTQGGALRRLPAASSGAATPVIATPSPGTPPASRSDGTTPPETASAEPTGEAPAAPLPNDPTKPDLRLFSRPIAVDAQTLKAGDTTLRLAGIQPIAPDGRCVQGAQAWPCATRARTAFRAWLRGRSVLCNVPAEALDSRDLVVPCLMGEEDVGAWLVSNGWASAAPGSRYQADEQKAREERRGLWAFDVQG